MTQKNDQLLGLLAVRTGVVSAKALAEAENQCSADKSVGLGEVFLRLGVLTEETSKLLENLVEKHLEMHGKDLGMSLATLNPSEAPPPSTVAKNVSAVEETVNFDHSNLPQNGLDTAPPPEGHSVDADKTQWSLATEPKGVGERYRVLRSHAKGGMGLVSVAIDKELDREVAFKELQEYCADDSNSRARFIQEAEITGQLEHPGVVPIYGLGAYPDGRPYYAMRFVLGDSLGHQIAEFHKTGHQHGDFSQGGLEFRALLGRFVDVCNAIAYAHSRGVLHRDLKPDNIMLGKFGETLVVDWGLAKAIGRKDSLPSDEPLIKAASGEGSTATRMGSATGTPAYMSPEQASGQLDRVGPASDVYSLGATLYCLLTGRAPIAGKSLTELLRKAQRGDYPSPKLVNPRVPVAMNSICCKAMSNTPADRYQSPLELAADIECWLSDEAVLAYHENLWERSSRWFRRHRTWALAGAAALAVVAVVAAFSAVRIDTERQKAVALAHDNEQLAMQERKAKQQATDRFKQSRNAVDTWLTGFSEALSYYPGVQKFRERMLLRAAEDYEQFVATEETDREMEIERGRALLRLGDVRRTLLQLDEAEKAYNDAETVFARLQDDGSGQSISLVELPQTMLRKAILAAELGKIDQAMSFYRHSIDSGQAILESQPADKIAQLAVADARSRLGMLLAAKGKGKEANDLLQSSIRQQKMQVEQSPESLNLLVSLANTRIALGQLLAQRGDIANAQEEFEEATDHYQTLLSKQQDNPRFLESKARALIHLATTHRMVGRWDLEAQAYQQAIMDYKKLISAMADVPVHRENLSLTQTDLGQLLRESFRPSEALEELTQARTVIEELAAEYPSVIRFHEERATCLDNLGEVLLDLGKYSESLAVHKEAEDIFGQLVENVPSIVQYRERHAICQSHLGIVYHALQQSELAEEEFRAAIESLEKYEALSPFSDSTLKSLATINEYYGDLLFANEKAEAACEVYTEAKRHWIKLLERSPQADYFHRAAVFHVMCRCEPVRDESLAVQYARQALESAPTNALYQGTLAAAHYRNKKFALSISLATEALRNNAGNQGRDYMFLGMAQLRMGLADKAKESFVAATSWRSENAPGNLTFNALQAEATQLQADTNKASKAP